MPPVTGLTAHSLLETILQPQNRAVETRRVWGTGMPDGAEPATRRFDEKARLSAGLGSRRRQCARLDFRCESRPFVGAVAERLVG